MHDQTNIMPGMGLGIVDLLIVKPDGACFRSEQPGEDPQQGGFTRAVATKQAERLARLYLKIKSIQNTMLTKRFGYLPYFEAHETGSSRSC